MLLYCVHSWSSGLFTQVSEAFSYFLAMQCIMFNSLIVKLIVVDGDQCQSNNCKHGTCVDQFQGYACHCDVGYEGKDCNYGEDGSWNTKSVLTNRNVHYFGWKVKCILTHDKSLCLIDSRFRMVAAVQLL